MKNEVVEVLRHYRQEAAEHEAEYRSIEPELSAWFRNHVDVLSGLIDQLEKQTYANR